MKPLICPNCGLQVRPKQNSLADSTIDQIVADDDRIRLIQLRDPSAPHSANLASGGFRHAD